MRRLVFLLPLVAVTPLVAITVLGCNRAPAIPQPQPNAAYAAQQRDIALAQSDLAQIPLPAKSQYLAVHSLKNWQNPYLTVQATVITLHVLLPDSNPTTLGEGTLLRPVGARRQDLTLRASDIPDALAAIPQGAWPYGRVIAVEEQRGAAPAEEPAIRRNVESTLKTLNLLGLVSLEWNEQPGNN